jgi:hypothetical protein
MERKKQKTTAKEIKKVQDIVRILKNDPIAMKQAEKLIASCN